jgi:hypothetical protein
VEEKKKSDSEFLSYNLMLNSGKKIALCATMSNIISLLVLAWNQKGKYYMIPLKKVVLILNILTIRTNLYGY